MNTKELFQRAHNGDKEAREQLILQNIRLVYKIAHKYKDKIDFDTVVQEGTIGLIKAVDRFGLIEIYNFQLMQIL